MMYTRQNLMQDLNALANHASRGDDLCQLRDELEIVVENVEEIIVEENKDALGQKSKGEHPETATAGSTEAG